MPRSEEALILQILQWGQVLYFWVELIQYSNPRCLCRVVVSTVTNMKLLWTLCWVRKTFPLCGQMAFKAMGCFVMFINRKVPIKKVENWDTLFKSPWFCKNVGCATFVDPCLTSSQPGDILGRGKCFSGHELKRL